MNIYKESAKVRGFYDIPYWSENEPKPIYWELFKWMDGDIFGQGKKAGELNEDLFDTLEKRIFYIQGVFEDSNGENAKGEDLLVLNNNKLYFANSPKKVERVKNWINEIPYKFHCEILLSGVIEHNIKYLCPVCHEVTLSPNVVKFIQEYKSND